LNVIRAEEGVGDLSTANERYISRRTRDQTSRIFRRHRDIRIKPTEATTKD